MVVYICDNFSLSMLDRGAQQKNILKRVPVPVEDPASAIKNIAEDNHVQIVSAVGHADIASIFSKILGFIVMVNHCDFKLVPDSVAIIGQYSGPSIPEGAVSLPPGGTIEWWMV